MPARRSAPALALLLAACGGAERGAPPAAPAVPPSAAGSTATSLAPSMAPSLAASTILRGAVAIEPSARLALSPGAEVVVDPRATFELELAARTPDARLVLVDAKDDFVAATSTRELGASTRLTLAPAAPLVPGSRYALRLDGTAERDLHDDLGRAFPPLTLPLLAGGTPPPPEPKKPARKKRRR